MPPWLQGPVPVWPEGLTAEQMAVGKAVAVAERVAEERETRANGIGRIVASCTIFDTVSQEVIMSTNLDALEAEVLKLAPADRSHLLERLIASLDSDPEIEKAWEQEADRREAELDSGVVSEVPGTEALGRLRAMLSR